MDSRALLHGVSGVLGGCAAMGVTYPLLTVTTRQQVNTEEDVGSIKLIFKILQEEGIQGLYSGLGPALFGIAATMGIYIYSYEVTTHFIHFLQLTNPNISISRKQLKE